MKYTNYYESPIGRIRIVSNGECLTELAFDGSQDIEKVGCSKSESITDDVIIQTRNWLDIYFSGLCPDFIPKISLKGTDFQMSVWKLLVEIPYGEVITYGELAKKIATQRGIAKMSAQATGAAVGSNPICIIVPCHRVIGSNGKLTGYSGGIERKAELLNLECENTINKRG